MNEKEIYPKNFRPKRNDSKSLVSFVWRRKYPSKRNGILVRIAGRYLANSSYPEMCFSNGMIY